MNSLCGRYLQRAHICIIDYKILNSVHSNIFYNNLLYHLKPRGTIAKIIFVYISNLTFIYLSIYSFILIFPNFYTLDNAFWAVDYLHVNRALTHYCKLILTMYFPVVSVSTISFLYSYHVILAVCNRIPI